MVALLPSGLELLQSLDSVYIAGLRSLRQVGECRLIDKLTRTKSRLIHITSNKKAHTRRAKKIYRGGKFIFRK
jgi:hypothetical protein